jgi:hypothetical protein
MAGPNLHVVRGPIPFPFEENDGQAPADVAFLLRAGGLRAAFGPQGIRYTVFGTYPPAAPDAASAALPIRNLGVVSGPMRAYTVEQVLVGARNASPIGTIGAPAHVNYLTWPDGHRLTDLPTSDQIARTDAWAGIDVLYERSETGVKSTYRVAPGADPGQIEVDWHGATATLAEDGSLRLETPLGTIEETRGQARGRRHEPGVCHLPRRQRR